MIKAVDRKEAILDATTSLLLRLGYDKLTMSDVADAVGLHRALLYRSFASKDELVEAVVLRELDRYRQAWREHLAADPRGGTVASVFRTTVRALGTMPLAAAIVTNDQEIFGRYLRQRGTPLERLSANQVDTRKSLRALQEAGALRRDVDTRAVAFILDALTPAVREALRTARTGSSEAGVPAEDLINTLADLLERALTPADVDLAAARAVLLSEMQQAIARSDAGGEVSR